MVEDEQTIFSPAWTMQSTDGFVFHQCSGSWSRTFEGGFPAGRSNPWCEGTSMAGGVSSSSNSQKIGAPQQNRGWYLTMVHSFIWSSMNTLIVPTDAYTCLPSLIGAQSSQMFSNNSKLRQPQQGHHPPSPDSHIASARFLLVFSHCISIVATPYTVAVHHHSKTGYNTGGKV